MGIVQCRLAERALPRPQEVLAALPTELQERASTPILQGISLVDNGMILQGAIPAALLALLVQWGFDLLDRVVIPRGLRLPPPRS